MAIDSLPQQPPINLRADAYAETALRLSRLAMMTTRCVLDIPYGTDYWQQLDIYLPEGEGLAGLPVFVNIHGGGWSHGYKEWMGLNAPVIVAFPAVYVSLSYRLAPTSRYPDPLEDCLAGLAWVHANIRRYGGDPNRIFVGGHSAGAHLAALLTLRTDLHQRYGLPRGVVKACFPYSGVYDLTMQNAEGARVRVPSTLPLVPADRPDQVQEASPLTYTANNRTPFLVTWAENDNAHCKAQGPIFLQAVKASGARAEGWMFPLFDHFWIHVDQQRPQNPWTRTLKAWMTDGPEFGPVASL
jgi:arylformamidase